MSQFQSFAKRLGSQEDLMRRLQSHWHVSQFKDATTRRQEPENDVKVSEKAVEKSIL